MTDDYAQRKVQVIREFLAAGYPAPYIVEAVVVTFPRFHRHLYKEECDEIGGRNDHENQTAVHGRV
jgi:hypothetical protein